MRTMTGFPAWAVDGFVVFALVYLAGSLELVEPFRRRRVRLGRGLFTKLKSRAAGGARGAARQLGAQDTKKER